MSSVPVQVLVYVVPAPTCPYAPIIQPFNVCLEIQVGDTFNFNISALSLCNATIAYITDIIVTVDIPGMAAGSLTTSTMNSSISYVEYSWTPQPGDEGQYNFCNIAYDRYSFFYLF